MRVVYNSLAIGPVLSFGKSVLEVDEAFFEASPQEIDHEFYEDIDPATPALVRKDQAAIDIIILNRGLAATQAEQDRTDQIADISSKISSKTREEITTAVANAGFTAPQTSLIEKMAIAIWAGAKLDGR